MKGPSQINIKEVKKPDLDAQILAEGVAQQLGEKSHVQKKSDEKNSSKRT